MRWKKIREGEGGFVADSGTGGVPGDEQEIVVRHILIRGVDEVIFRSDEEEQAREVLRKFKAMECGKVEMYWGPKVTEGVS